MFRCHECYALVDIAEVAHIDMYSDLCWVQCKTCQEAFGWMCGCDRRWNPHPHGYFNCPLRPGASEDRPPNVTHIGERRRSPTA